MSEPSIVVRCPHCGHPYPLTDLQREVYRGRTMGCVNCGRPIHVDAAIAAQFPAAPAGAAVGPGGAAGGAAEGDSDDGARSPADTAVGSSIAGQDSPADPAGDAAAAFAPAPGGPSGPAAAALRPNTAAVISLTSGIV